MPAAVATCGSLLAALLALALPVRAQGGGPPPIPSGMPEALDSPLRVRPLDSLRVTGGYGEPRSNHFHAGFDFSTGGRVGEAVRAPLPGWVERVRASGSGYGRSLYLRAADGRLLVFGHLDAFAPALAAWVDSVQRASGRYEQDLWPAAGRFRAAAGDTVAWSGQSGAGGPHLHLEIRHGDFALHPLRGGLVLAAPRPPRILSLTLEPLDAASRVEGGVWPRTFTPGARPDTIEVEGRMRAAVRTASGVPGAGDAPAWSTSLAWGGETVEARLDSISWAGEMSELDEVLDRGRIAGRGGWLLWAPGGWRPRFVRASAPLEQEAGTIVVRRGDPARELRLAAREPGGALVERVFVLRPPAGPAPARPAAPGGTPPPARAGEPAWTFTVLPGPLLRVRVTQVPPDLGRVRIACVDDTAGAGAAQWDGAGYVAVLAPPALPARAGFRITGRGADSREWSNVAPYEAWPAGRDTPLIPRAGARLTVGARAVFEPGVVLLRALRPVDAPTQGLRAAGPRVLALPEALPLRSAVVVTLDADSGAVPAGLGIYRRRGAGAWEWMGAARDSGTAALSAESSFLGEFALMLDFASPRLRLLTPPRWAADGPYSRWQLVATVAEVGSGIDASASAFFVDGVRVPTEWDPETRQLRWRPLTPPAEGRHAFELRAADRAGNPASLRGTFVLDSARR